MTDLKFHISCNDWIISPKEIKSLTIIDSVLMYCIQVREILTFLENYSKGLHSASTYTKSAREFLNCVLELRDDEEKCNKIGFLLNKLNYWWRFPQKACISTSIFISLFSMIFHKNKTYGVAIFSVSSPLNTVHSFILLWGHWDKNKKITLIYLELENSHFFLFTIFCSSMSFQRALYHFPNFRQTEIRVILVFWGPMPK